MIGETVMFLIWSTLLVALLVGVRRCSWAPAWTVRDSLIAFGLGILAWVLPGSDSTMTGFGAVMVAVGVGSLPLTLWRRFA